MRMLNFLSRHRWFGASLMAAAFLSSGCVSIGKAPENSGPVALRYGFSLSTGTPLQVTIHLEFQGEADGSTVLLAPSDWGGVEHCHRFIGDLSVRTANGDACLMEELETDRVGWRVSHAPNETIVVTYPLTPSPYDALADPNTRFEPTIREDLVHFLGNTALVYPEAYWGLPEVEVHFHWSGHEARGWQAVSPFDNQEPPISLPLPALLHAPFVAGPLRIHDREIASGRLRIAMHGNQWPFRDESLVDLIQDIVDLERQFVSEEKSPDFLITVVPCGPHANSGQLSVSGTSLARSFALFLAPGAMLDSDPMHRRHITKLLAHESFHTWNAGEIAFEQPEVLSYWFSEGFTEFYATRLLWNAGYIDNTQYRDSINAALRSFWLNPGRDAGPERLMREFWSSPHMGSLPMNKGWIIALMLDEEVRRQSDNRFTVDDCFLAILQTARQGKVFRSESLLQEIANWVSPEFLNHLQEVVLSRATPQVPERMTDLGLRSFQSTEYAHDPGFNVEESLDAKVAIGVTQDGPAFRAGLRNGDKFATFSVQPGDSSVPFEFGVAREGEIETIRFLPRGASMSIPQYSKQ